MYIVLCTMVKNILSPSGIFQTNCRLWFLLSIICLFPSYISQLITQNYELMALQNSFQNAIKIAFKIMKL
jgi:hypothetical protein